MQMHTIKRLCVAFPLRLVFTGRGGRSANWADGRCQFTNAAERAVSISNAGGMVGGKRGQRAFCRGRGVEGAGAGVRTGEWLTNAPFTQLWQVKSIYLRCYRLIGVGSFTNLPQGTEKKLRLQKLYQFYSSIYFMQGSLRHERCKNRPCIIVPVPPFSGGIPPMARWSKQWQMWEHLFQTAGWERQ